MQQLDLIKIQSTDEIPFELLLLADETIEAIEKYIYKADVYVLTEEQRTVAVAALYQLTADEIEIKNIAVAASHQNKGIGSFLIQQIIMIAREHEYKTLIVGAADTGDQQIRFYEHNGFRKYAKRKKFFIENYPGPIIENGRVLKDMILLRYAL